MPKISFENSKIFSTIQSREVLILTVQVRAFNVHYSGRRNEAHVDRLARLLYVLLLRCRMMESITLNPEKNFSKKLSRSEDWDKCGKNTKSFSRKYATELGAEFEKRSITEWKHYHHSVLDAKRWTTGLRRYQCAWSPNLKILFWLFNRQSFLDLIDPSKVIWNFC